MTLTDKIYRLITSVGIYNLTEIEKNKLVKSLDAQYIQIDGDIIMTHQIRGIVHGDRLLDLDKIKKGEWKCKYDQWHTKGEQCGHDGKHW